MQTLVKMSGSEIKSLQHSYEISKFYKKDNQKDVTFVSSIWKDEVILRLSPNKTFIALIGKKYNNSDLNYYIFINSHNINESDLFWWLYNKFFKEERD